MGKREQKRESCLSCKDTPGDSISVTGTDKRLAKVVVAFHFYSSSASNIYI